MLTEKKLLACALTRVSCPTHPQWTSHHTVLGGALGLQSSNWFGSCALYVATHWGWAIYRTLCEDMSLEKKTSTELVRCRTGNRSFYDRLVSSGPHLGCCSLRQTLSYPRSSLQSLYWAQWQSRPLSVYWSSGSLSDHPPCHLKSQLLSPEAAGHRTLKKQTNSELNQH